MEISLKKHILSHMLIRRNKVLILYKEQPITFYGCNEQGHQYQDCPIRKSTGPPQSETTTNTWANIVAQGHTVKRPDAKNRVTTDVQVETYEANNAEDPTVPHDGGQSTYQAEPKITTSLETSSKPAGNQDGERENDIAASMLTGTKDPPDSNEDIEEDNNVHDRASQPLKARDAEIGNNADGHKTRPHYT